jgi:RNA polymerase sigma factor (sigma-70 family)
MEYLSSVTPATPELNHLYNRLRIRAQRKFLPQAQTRYEDALASAVQDGFLIFLRKQRTTEQQIRNPEAFAFEIIKRTFWDYRRRAQRRDVPQDPAELTPYDLYPRPRFANGDSLFASLPEPYLWHWYQKLSSADQQLIDLRCLGYGHREIAQLLQMSYGNVRNKFSNLIKAAKEHTQP